MPRVNIKPVLKLTKEQGKALIERLMAKEGKLTPKVANELLKYEPPVERSMGILHKDLPIGVGESTRKSEILPLGEARAKYFADPEAYSNPSMGAPSAKVLRKVEPGSPEELASGLAYERNKFSPIVPYTVKQASKVSKQTIKDMVIENPKMTKDVALPPAQEMLSHAVIADNMWKLMTGRAGSRSMAAKVWENLNQASRLKSQGWSTRDYFINSYTRFKRDPKKFVKTFPREARILDQMEREFGDAVYGGE